MIALLFPALLLATPTASPTQDAAALPALPALQGAWRSEGYGELVVFEGAEVRVYELSKPGALLVGRGERVDDGSAPALAAFAIASDGAPELVGVAPGGGARSLEWRRHGAPTPIVLRRLPAAPLALERPLPDDPLPNFDVFWSTFDAHYTRTAEHAPTWNALREPLRARAAEATDAAELFAVFEDALRPLADESTFVATPDFSTVYVGRREEPAEDYEPVPERFFAAPLERAAAGALAYAPLRATASDGHTSGVVGYLRVERFERWAEEAGYDAGRRAGEAAFDRIFRVFEGASGLVIDLRGNRGGYDLYATALAGRLTEETYIGFEKSARADEDDPATLTPAQPVVVRASPGPGFAGKVALLHDAATAGAAEAFLLTLEARPGPTRRFGRPTAGLLSDVLVRRLPNGFHFGLPNETYFGVDGASYEGRGVPPHEALGAEAERKEADAALAAAQAWIASPGAR